MGEKGYPTEIAIAGVYAALSEGDTAIEWLDRAYEQHSSYLVAINCEPTFEDLRSDPRFQALLKKIGFPEVI